LLDRQQQSRIEIVSLLPFYGFILSLARGIVLYQKIGLVGCFFMEAGELLIKQPALLEAGCSME